MRLLIVQHDGYAHAGRFRAMLARDRVATRAVIAPRIGTGGWPGCDDFDALWVLGGAMQVWETDRHPWLGPEIGFIRRAVADWGKPYFGVCFGHQLLAAALGGAVGPAAGTELGVRPVTGGDPAPALLAGLPARFAAFQWHSAEVTRAPGGLRVDGSSPACGNQVMTGPGAVAAVQFHPEIDTETLRDWLAAPGCRADLEALQGQGAEARLFDALDRAEADLDRLARRLYDNWMGLARPDGRAGAAISRRAW